MRKFPAFLWLLLLVAPAISSGQTESAASEEDPFFETVDVNVVNVEVVGVGVGHGGGSAAGWCRFSG